MTRETTDDGPYYPGGEDARGYRIAFQLWLVVFLVVLCFGLANFIASWLHG